MNACLRCGRRDQPLTWQYLPVSWRTTPNDHGWLCPAELDTAYQNTGVRGTLGHPAATH